MVYPVIKVLVVDDSAVMVRLLSEIINSDPELYVIGTASHGIEAVRQAELLAPDVITMDVHMPRMDGIKAVDYIMNTTPIPIIMISSLTQGGAAATIQALDLGAIDFVSKPSGYVSLDIEDLAHEIIAKIKLAAKIHVVRSVGRPQPFLLETGKPGFTQYAPRPSLRSSDGGTQVRKKPDYKRVVAIGCSTGGPVALHMILHRLPANFPVPILVVQHMPEKFTEKLAESLNNQVSLHVVEAKNGMALQRGFVYIAAGGYHMRIRSNRTIHLQKEENSTGPCPSIDILMISVADVFGKHVVGVILTGMGDDGVNGMNAIKDKKGLTIAQDEETSLVFGMPKVAIESGCIDSIVPLSLVADEIMNSL